MRIVDAPCEYALGKDPQLQAIRIEDLYEYKDNVKTDKIVGQTLTLGLMKTFERLVIEAAIKGDRDLAVTALNMNPLCPSDEIANIVIDELLEAHKDYLPQFFNK